MKRLYIAGSMLTSLFMISVVYAQQADNISARAAEQLAIQTCGICHGVQGRSISPRFPVLAGQQVGYLTTQLQAFRSHTRSDPDAVGYMWGMTASLSDEMINELAEYFSKQTPLNRDAPATAALNTRGKEIYEHGDTGAGIAACATCHGERAAGNGMFPRLAGQHRQYLVSQMMAYQSNMRSTVVMRTMTRGLNPGDIQAVAAYLQSLSK